MILSNINKAQGTDTGVTVASAIVNYVLVYGFLEKLFSLFVSECICVNLWRK